MKTIFILFILNIIKAGHIYVSEPSMFYGNKDYIKSIEIMLKLESGLYIAEIIKIVWPF